MKPSDVNLFKHASMFPLVATFGRAEQEFAAALIVRACFVNGDEWQAVALSQVQAAMTRDMQAGGVWFALKENPFVRPDFRGLVTKGYAVFMGDPDGKPAPPIEFTELGLKVLEGKAA